MKFKLIHIFVLFNYIKFKLHGIHFGKHLRVYNLVYVRKGEGAKISIGDSLSFSSGGGHNPINGNVRGYLRADDNAEIMIGNNCGMSSTVLWAKDKIHIGNNVLIGGGCLLLDSDSHSLDYRIRNGSIRDKDGKNMDSKMARTKPICIEDDVLIGARSIILKGVTIGARSVIGAGSVVTTSIPSDCIAAGNPCRVIKEQKYEANIDI